MWRAGLPDQAIWRATLSMLPNATAGAGKLSPCVIIVGQVAGAQLVQGAHAVVADELTSSADDAAAVELISIADAIAAGTGGARVTRSAFLEQWMLNTVQVKAGARTRLTGDSSLYKGYKEACDRAGLVPLVVQQFSRKLERRLAYHYGVSDVKWRDNKGTLFLDVCMVEAVEPCPAA